MGWARRSINSTSLSSHRSQVWDGHEVVAHGLLPSSFVPTSMPPGQNISELARFSRLTSRHC
jgi:hypothetical protein